MCEYNKALTCRKFYGLVREPYHSPEFTKAVCSPRTLWTHGGMRVLQEGRNRVGVISLTTGMGQRDVVVKEFRVHGFDRIKSRFQLSKAQKAWRGSCFLQKKGVPTPAPIAFLEPHKHHLPGNGFFLCEWEPEAVEIRTRFQVLSGEKMEHLLKDLAIFLNMCHDKGILHRDLSDGNILVSEKGHHGLRFSLLDTNRIRNRKRISGGLRAKNLIRLGIPSGYQRFFIQCYRGSSSKIFWFWYRFNKKIFSGYIRMKKKLKLKKLARALRIQ